MTLDGVMQAPGGPEEDPTGGFAFGGWTAPYWDEVMGAAMGGVFSEPYDLLLGRKTYDIFAAHWPYAGAEDPIAQAFKRCAKYVATRSADRTFTWENTHPLRGDAAAEVTRLKSGEGPNLLTQGSSDFLQTLLAAGLVDELRLLIFPVVLGTGKRLFGSGAAPVALKLEDTQVSTTGVIIGTYRPEGSIVTGSFALEEPSAAELERRRELARES